MQHIDTPGDLMKRMTEPLSPSWLAGVVGVTTQTVNRWKHGQNVTQPRLEAVAEALRRLLPEHKEPAAPDWERLEATVYAIARKLRVEVPDELMARAMDQELGRELAERRHDEPSPGQGNGQEVGSPDSKQPEP